MTRSIARRTLGVRTSTLMSLTILAAGVAVVSIAPASRAFAQSAGDQPFGSQLFGSQFFGSQVLSYANEASPQSWPRDDDAVVSPNAPTVSETGADVDVLPPQLRRQVVDYRSSEAPGTVIIDTPHTVLYYVLGGQRAIRYGVGVGRDGFTWSGTQTITRKAEWPDWIPPSEMIARQPYLPRFGAGGPGKPLGARAMYLGASAYRIHGTNDPTTIGKFVSSGCIRMTNTDVQDLFGRVNVGTKVVVLPKTSGQARAVSAPHGRVAPRPLSTAANLTSTPNPNGSGLY
jgi:lipoprotein-anchoring transpeptidase ErfK/SrfK